METFNNPFFYKTNFRLVQKICLAGLFIAMAMICQKVFAVNYIAAIPFVRISFGGPALIILSSILLGPWFGLLVGTASDVLGYFILDPKSNSFFPQITLIYSLLGFLSYFIFCLVRFFKNKKSCSILLYAVIFIFLLAISLTMTFNSRLVLFSNTIDLALWQRISIPFILLGLFVLLIVLIKIFDYRFIKKEINLPFNVYQIALASLIIEVVVMIIFGSIMKACAFSFKTYPVILLTQIVVSFLNVLLNTVLISYIIYITRRYFTYVPLEKKKSS